MPNRILKETICTSEEIDALTVDQECFFYRLMVVVDDFGTMDARPAILKARCYPLKSIDNNCVQALLCSLRDVGLVQLYEVDGRPYLHVKNWAKHQQIRAKTSKYPVPPIAVDINCNQAQSNVPVIQSNPIVYEDEVGLAELLELEKEVFIPAEAGKEKSQGKTSGPPKRAIQLPEDFVPDATCVELAVSLGRSASAELPAFADFHRSKGSTFKDWQSAFRTWLRNSVKFGSPASTTASTHAFDPCRGAI